MKDFKNTLIALFSRPHWLSLGLRGWWRQNFKTSRVRIYKCFTSLSEIERKFFVFVGILEKGDGDALCRNHYSSAISQLTFRVSNTYTSPFIIKWSMHRWPKLTLRRKGCNVTLTVGARAKKESGEGEGRKFFEGKTLGTRLSIHCFSIY